MPPKKKFRSSLNFSAAFGDLSPLEQFNSSSTPSRRDVFRLFRHRHFVLGKSLNDAAKYVVDQLLLRHSFEDKESLKTPYNLELDVKNLYTKIRFEDSSSILKCKKMIAA